MTELTVWTFSGPARGRRAVREVRALTSQSVVEVDDGALVEWREGERSPRAGQLEELAGPRALGVTFWDMIFGLVFLLPLLTEEPDAAPARLWDSLVDGGIPDTFLDQVREHVVPGTSALWLLGPDEISGVLSQRWPRHGAGPIVARLDDQRQRALHEVFPR
jgi:uncharacterized membrane protein